MSGRKKASTRNVLSLFSGCGGMDLGLEGGFCVHAKSVNAILHPDWKMIPMKEEWVFLPKTTFQTVFANDIRKEAKRAWCEWFTKKDANIYHLASIVDLVKKEKEQGGIFPKNIDVVTGGFPCQDFSVSGKRKGFSSDKSHTGKKRTQENDLECRGQLYLWMREVIALVQPNVFLAENVKGLVSLADAKAIIESDFASVCEGGYLVVPAKVLQAAEYGVPQSRERIVFIGFRKQRLTKEAQNALSREEIPESYNPYPIATHGKLPSKEILPYLSCKDYLCDLKEPEDSIDLSQQAYSKGKYLGKGKQGQIEVNLEGIAPTIRSEHHGNIEYRRLSLAHGGKNADELEQGLQERRLTVRECARLQTFPDDYAFVIPSTKEEKGVSASSAYKLIGNAVPPLFAYHFAKRLEENWEKYFGKEISEGEDI
jgi:DNA (cytosine-5)-methyltransferase 1